MTIAQQLEQKGIEKGIEMGMMKGMALGEQRGFMKAKLAIAQTMLHHGLSLESIMQMTGLSEVDLAHISH